MDGNQTILYEQPLNEQIRICLRIEHLSKQFHNQLQTNDAWQTRAAMATLLKIVSLVDRPDLKPKLAQALSQHATALTALQTVPEVHTQKLQQILKELDDSMTALHHCHGKFGEKLRQNEFLNHIRLHIGNPAGACDYATPEFFLWLNRPAEERHQQLKQWFSEFDLLFEVVNLHLRITRSSTPTQIQTAEKGFFQQTMDANNPALLLRAKIPATLNCYPEISVGKHRLTIRFVEMIDFTKGIGKQYPNDFQFELACCKVG